MSTRQSGEIWAVSVDCTASTSVSQMWRDTWFCKIFPWRGVGGVGGGNRVKPTRDLSVLFLPTACQSTKPAGQQFQSWSLNEGEESRLSIHGGDGHPPLCISRMKETLISELACISVHAMRKYLVNTKIFFFLFNDADIAALSSRFCIFSWHL